MPITIKLIHLDHAVVTVHVSWWSRMFGREVPSKIAMHDRFGWRWNDTQDPILNLDIVKALDRALKKQRGY